MAGLWPKAKDWVRHGNYIHEVGRKEESWQRVIGVTGFGPKEDQVQLCTSFVGGGRSPKISGQLGIFLVRVELKWDASGGGSASMPEMKTTEFIDGTYEALTCMRLRWRTADDTGQS